FFCRSVILGFWESVLSEGIQVSNHAETRGPILDAVRRRGKSLYGGKRNPRNFGDLARFFDCWEATRRNGGRPPETWIFLDEWSLRKSLKH
ncbi:MAG: hypothetical protein AAF585_16320, partial [Verrucomicrobiota bacterium]